MAINKEPNTINYFLPGPSQDNDKRVNAAITQQLQRDCKDVFPGIGCFYEMFSLQVKPDSKPYQAPKVCSLCNAKTFQRGVRTIPTIRHHNTTRHWSDSRMVQQFVLVPISNAKLRLCLVPARLKQALKRLVHRGPTLNDISPKLNNVQYLSLINACSGYHT